ncbi:pyrimidodiazepine synthase-like [Bacillus rossius redtenbacheri]|uniref:pyrimidodiazepine synthase-like n=1 Tax=Bacillus rossius redtenbacheri TaxID=93214 RepID=UPI002FDE0727
MSSAHLGLGSKCPPAHKCKLRLYSMRFCPYAQRIHLVLDAKKIPYEVVNVNLTQKPEWLYSKSPQGKVPVLELDGDCLHESAIIADYLDDKYQHWPLHPRDPWKKAKDKLLLDQFNKVVCLLMRMLRSPRNIDKLFMEELMEELDVFEAELTARGTPFYGGSRPGMLDYMIWPWCERSDMPRIVVGDRWNLPKERFRHLMEWRGAMKDDEAVKKSFLESSVHAKYFMSAQAGSPDYDLLLH